MAKYGARELADEGKRYIKLESPTLEATLWLAKVKQSGLCNKKAAKVHEAHWNTFNAINSIVADLILIAEQEISPEEPTPITNIPASSQKIQGRVSLFVSYSWDSEHHKVQVENLVERLKADGFNVVWDGNQRLGTRLTQFMENSIDSTDYTIFICTEKYKEKADARNGGAGYETNVITGLLYNTKDEHKFIPVLFAGRWETALPLWAASKLGVDLSKSETYEREYNRLKENIASANGEGANV
jgi:hypothetical protein